MVKIDKKQQVKPFLKSRKAQSLLSHSGEAYKPRGDISCDPMISADDTERSQVVQWNPKSLQNL